MQTGNLFTLLGIVDPDGDPLRIAVVDFEGAGVDSIVAGGSATGRPHNGEADSTMEVFSNGNFSFDPGSAKTGRFGPQTLWVEIRVTDDKDAQHAPDATIDFIEIINFNFNGDLAPNSPPVGSPSGTSNIAYVPDTP